MLIVHNKTVFEVLEEVKDELEDVNYDLELALDELNDALETSDEDDKDRWISKAITLIQEAKDKLHKS